ncbi:MAG: DUF3078 domain-containing protein [Bacteroidia bacterium]
MKTIFTFFLLIINITIYAQVTESEKNIRTVTTDTILGWKKGAVTNLGLTQVSLTNWAAGGENSISANALVSLFANYKNEKDAWDNSLDVGYGFLKQGKKKMIKTDDKIDFTSKYGKKIGKGWYIAALVNFRTQMTDGYNYPNDSIIISRFMAPGYLLGALGLDYMPNDNFDLFIAPLTSKSTFVMDQKLANEGAYGVEKAVYDTTGFLITKGKTYRSEFGGYIRMTYKKNLMENVFLQNKIDLFSNYLHNPQNIDINWEVLIALKVNKFLTTSISTQLLYDDDVKISIDKNKDGIVDAIGPRTQFKEVLAVGLSYKF